MKENIVIIGSGIGGLTAGALLAQRGYKVLVFEQNHKIGGCCQSFSRRGHRFDAGASLFLGCGPRGYNPLYQVLRTLGISLELDELDPCFSVSNSERSIPIRPDLEQTLASLEAWKAGTSAQARNFFRGFHLARRAVDALPFHRPFRLGEALVWFLKHGWYLPIIFLNDHRSVGRILDRTVHDPQLRAILEGQLKAFAIESADMCPAILGSILYTEPFRGGISYPRGGADAIAQSLGRKIVEHGGEIKLSTEVEKISVRDGKASAVRLVGGETIAAPTVISNAGAWTTFSRLVDETWLSPKFSRRITQLRPSGSVFIHYLSLERAFAEEGKFPVHTMWQEEGKGQPAMMLSIPSLADAAAAPTGSHAAMLYCGAEYGEWQRNERYSRDKMDQSEKIMASFERRVPGIRSPSQVIATATPLTVERYTLREFGSIGGPRSTMDQWQARNLPHRTPIQGLYHCGDSTFPGAGVVAVTVSGIMTADEITHSTPVPDRECQQER